MTSKIEVSVQEEDFNISEELEKIKNLNSYQSLINKILEKQINRNSTIVAIGGGTVGDLVGFIASTILRGVKLVLIPTTLLSQVDSSIGGKNGINTSYGKNLLGTFYQPNKVIIDPKILKSLPKREIKSGYAEILKHAIINDLSFFNWLNNNYKKIFNLDKRAITYAIYKSIKIKAYYVTKDTEEKLTNSNSRAILNFGHTFGHALETLYNYKKITHGEAISIGMSIASKLSYKISKLSKSELDKIISHLKKVNLPIYDKNLKNKKLISLIKNDKKNKDNNLNLILIKKIGKAYYSKNVKIKNITDTLNLL